MPSSSLAALRRVHLLGFGMLLAVLSLVIAPAVASAHDVLVSSSPAVDSSVETLPAELVLTFSANLIEGPQATQIEITAPDGRPVHAGEPVVAGTTVTVPLIAEAPAGVYSVSWRVVGSDTHPISGEFSFEVLSSTETAPAPSTSPAPTTVPPSNEEAPADGLTRSLPFLLGIFAFAVLGTTVLMYLRSRYLRRGNQTSDAG